MITYQAIEGMPAPDVLEKLFLLYADIFDKQYQDEVVEKMYAVKRLYTIVAWHDDQAVGFKIGYAEKKNRFYSWLGGVSSKYRQQGIGSTLLSMQHSWCQKQGFQSIQTKTKNKWRSMLILNLKNGFDIIGTYTDEEGEPKIILEKKL